MSLNDDIRREEAKRHVGESTMQDVQRALVERHGRARAEVHGLLREAAQHLRRTAPPVHVVGRMKSYGKGFAGHLGYEPPVVGPDAYRRVIGYPLSVPGAGLALITDDGELFGLTGVAPHGIYQYEPTEWVQSLEKPTALESLLDSTRGLSAKKGQRKDRLAVERQRKSNSEDIGRIGVGVGELFSVGWFKIEYESFAELNQFESRWLASALLSGQQGKWTFGLAGSEPHLVVFGYESTHVGPSVRQWLSEAIVAGRTSEHAFPTAHW